jgi:hypothetical protein
VSIVCEWRGRGQQGHAGKFEGSEKTLFSLLSSLFSLLSSLFSLHDRCRCIRVSLCPCVCCVRCLRCSSLCLASMRRRTAVASLQRKHHRARKESIRQCGMRSLAHSGETNEYPVDRGGTVSEQPRTGRVSGCPCVCCPCVCCPCVCCLLSLVLPRELIVTTFAEHTLILNKFPVSRLHVRCPCHYHHHHHHQQQQALLLLLTSSHSSCSPDRFIHDVVSTADGCFEHGGL